MTGEGERSAGAVGRDCVRLQSKWLENNRAACPAGTAGRKHVRRAHEGDPRVKSREREGKRERGRGKEKAERRKEKEIGRNREDSRGREKERGMCCTTGRIEAAPRWQGIEKRPETRESERERDTEKAREKERKGGKDREREQRGCTRGRDGIIDADMCSSLGGSNP